ncbi:MAG: FecCD family ABC transporter permease [Solirubrobacteraceae bacterium]
MILHRTGAEARTGRRAGGRRAWLVALGLGIVALVAAVADIAWGGNDMRLDVVVRSLTVGVDGGTDLVVRDLQLPRASLALLVGVAFGLAGGVFQSVLRNPLASPDIVGTAHGASLAGVAGLLLGASYVTSMGLAALGALGATVLCLVLAPRRDVLLLVLVGIGIAAMAGAGISFLLTVGDISQTSRAAVWLVGSLNGTDAVAVRATALGLLVLVPLLVLLARRIDVLVLGDDVAGGLGIRVGRDRALLLAVAAGLVGVGVAAVGPLAFVAFLAPQIARRLAGTVAAVSLPACATSGAALVAVADLLGRRVGSPGELPVGIVTAALGATAFLLLLARQQRARTGPVVR